MLKQFAETLKRSKMEPKSDSPVPIAPRLAVCHGDRIEAIHSLQDTDTLTIGRAPHSDVVLEHRAVSRTHCRVVRNGDGFELEDAGSRNGTAVNGEPLGPSERRTLAHGDVIHVDHVCLVYLGPTEIEEPPSRPGHPRAKSLEIDRERVQEEVRRALDQIPGLRNVHAESESSTRRDHDASRPR